MYCIYLRKSRADVEAESRGEGETLQRHENILIDLARKQNLHISKIYKEVVSGETISSRPVMQELLSEVEQGSWKGVLVVEVERLARGDTMDQGLVAQTFKYSDTKIITPMKIYDPQNEYDEEYFEFGLFMSRREYKTINRRLQRGRLESVREGKYVGSVPPYGYNRKKLEREKGYTLEINPDQADVVKLIFELYTNGELQENSTYKRLGVSLIAKKLDSLKIPTMKGGSHWSPETIRGILKNPVYVQKIKWGSRAEEKRLVDGKKVTTRPRNDNMEIFEGLHESIVDIETFDLAQSYFSDNRAVPLPSKNKIKNPLAGIIVCGMCNKNMVRRPYANYAHDSLICPSGHCKNVASHLYLVEDKLIEVLKEWLKNYELEIEVAKKNEGKNIKLDVLNSNIKSINENTLTLEKQLDNLHNLLEQGIYSTDIFLDRSKKLNEQLQLLHADKEQLEGEFKRITGVKKQSQVIIPKIKNIIKVYYELNDPADKNQLLKEVLKSVTYTREVGGRWKSSDNFELELFIKLTE